MFYQNPISRAQSTKWQYDENQGSEQLIWGEELKQSMKAEFTTYKTLRFEVFNDWLPNDNCFVDLDEEVTNKWGDQVAKIRIGAHNHDLDVVENLFVTDASFMPTGGSVPYTFTIYANSFRVADHIKSRWQKANA